MFTPKNEPLSKEMHLKILHLSSGLKMSGAVENSWKDNWCWKLPCRVATSENDRLHIYRLCSYPSTREVKHLLVPWVRFTNVFPIWRVLNMEGALTSYQSFLVKGSTLESTNNRHD